jgi:hypothetical protein
MNRTTTIALRVSLILAAAATAAACVSDSSGPLGFASKRTTIAQAQHAETEITGTVPARTAATAGRPITASTLNPPPSHVEIRALCWREFEGAAADLDTKTALTQACVDRRIGR